MCVSPLLSNNYGPYVCMHACVCVRGTVGLRPKLLNKLEIYNVKMCRAKNANIKKMRFRG